MATSSIDHNFVITDKKTASRFMKIVNSPAESCSSSVKYSIISDSQEISSMMTLRKNSGGH